VATVVLAMTLPFLSTIPRAGAVPFTNALRLDGIDDWASAPDSSSLDIGVGSTSDATFETFFYVPNETANGDTQHLFRKHYAYGVYVVFHQPPVNDQIYFRWWACPAPFCEFAVYAGRHLTTGWHHVAAVFDNEWTSDHDLVGLFLDGEFLGAASNFEITPGLFNSTLSLGVGAYNGAAPYDGWLDEARLSTTVRYTGDYSVPASPFVDDANTAALWHFDDPPCTTTFADGSGNGNTLTGWNGANIGVPGASPPSLRFQSSSWSAGEGGGAATITVTRAGDPAPVVGVDYASSNGTATSESDYTSATGTLAFSCGQTTKTFQVPILQDSSLEPDETVNLSLSNPTGGASLGSPAGATLTIQDDDAVVDSFQPDGKIKVSGTATFVGNDVYNTTGASQTRTANAKRGVSKVFVLQWQNDGTAADDFALKGPGSNAKFTVKYLAGATGTTNITAQVVAGTYVTTSVPVGGSRTIRVVVTVKASAIIGSSRIVLVTATSQADGAAKDAVKAVVRVV
jgi:hypothetical protein